MATYAIGDLQGCYDSLLRLLDKLKFDSAQDTLWFAGDLVNRGPDSLSTLRFAKSLGDNAVTVLGNHDLHLLAIAAKHKKTHDVGLKDILHADDAAELLDWLRMQPLLHHDKELNFTMVHAGIYPEWDLKTAQQSAHELESVLRSENYLDFIFHMYGNLPGKWDDNLQSWDRLRFICNSFTRMRYCEKDSTLNFHSHGAPGTHPENTLPWFELPSRKMTDERIIFGHWSTLGKINKKNVYALDTGCVWGGELTALRIDCEEALYISVDCPGDANPADYMK
ncbi:MAG: symmetrical bis(5'-nucleosyl)-tetraphosphatase [Gammaproteobacteria bacterium]|nr:symmetrical bis(5'-nucleosyl)-tetraphosphatase [Gammaproteobacteria bacterium]MCW8988537.1 symmetrical bis(5'-nucleosyl)-tetraphosphatase [Gammaproteobacteria bacterium]